MNNKLKVDIEKLNDEQRKVALHKDGPMLVIAGAGAGKTHTLITRVSYLISEGVDPENILLLTFTNKAADEMKERAGKTIEGAERIAASTYHSFCVKMLRKYGRNIGISPNFTILSGGDVVTAINLVKSKTPERYSFKDFPPTKLIAELISKAMNTGKPFYMFCNAMYGIEYPDEVKKLVFDYLDYKKQNNLLDFDDLLYRFYELISKKENIRDIISDQYKYIMVDEYQDTNTLQEKIVLRLRENNYNVVVVGDDSQSIYGFRGAEISNILNFHKKLPGCKIVTVDKNYRSGQAILDIANKMMKNATEGFRKTMKAQKNITVNPKVIETDNQYEASKQAFNLISEFRKEGIEYKNIAILERNSSSSNMLEAMLNSNSIQYQKYGGIKFFERAAVIDLVAFFRCAFNRNDELAWFRILSLISNIGKKKATEIAEQLKNNNLNREYFFTRSGKKKSFTDDAMDLFHVVSLIRDNNKPFKARIRFVCDYYIKIRNDAIKNAKRKSNDTLQEAIEAFDNDKLLVSQFREIANNYNLIEELFDSIVLGKENSYEDSDKLVISTVHSAKGLEYDAVIILDAVNAIFPRTDIAIGSKEDNEELRCFYVAVTRAKRFLYFMCPEEVMIFGKRVRASKSRYLEKII